MATLQLIIKEHYLADIVTGKKKIETRDIRPKNAKKYIVYSDDENTVVTPKKYETITFFAGYNTDRKTAVVQVKGAEIFIITDDEGQELEFEEDGTWYCEAIIEYELGKVISHNY